MITPEQIPDEVVKTLEQALLGRPLSARNCTAAIAAALNAWPGTGHCHRDEQIARLRAEVEKVGRDYNTVRDAHDDWVRESERLRVEVKKMRADIAYADKHASKVEGLLWGTAKENEKLRAAIWAISETLCEIDRQNTTLRTENEKLRAALEWYADTFCEGPAGPLCGKLDDTRCSGCKARAAMEEK